MIELEKIIADSEDIDDVLQIVQKSYDIKFDKNELRHVKTFGELCDIIINKLQFTSVDDCTSQQAFYKLRVAYLKIRNTDRLLIEPKSDLEEFFPRKKRRSHIHRLENELGFKIDILMPKPFIQNIFLLLLGFSFISLFPAILRPYGVAGFFLSVCMLYIINKLGKEFKVKTFGQLANRMTIENYIKSRRNPMTINKQEIRQKIESLFIDRLDLPMKKISDNAKF